VAINTTAMLVSLVTQKEKVDVMVKKVVVILLFHTICLLSNAQNDPLIEGTITYANAVNVYVRFSSTNEIKAGDTLYIFDVDQWKPGLIVNKLSSISCVTSPFSNPKIKVGDRVAYRKRKITVVDEKTEKPAVKNELVKEAIVLPDSVDHDEKEKAKVRKQTYSARLTASTNASIDDGDNNFQRMRMALAFNVNNLKGSKWSIQSYITYRHRYGVDQSQIGFYDDFKIYAMAVSYDATKNTNISFGRKINNKIANMGAIDGIQVEHKIKEWIVGFFGGSRPDILNYSFNQNLLQTGGYIAHEKIINKGLVQTSFAFAEQTNNAKTDRRFAYMQHSNNIIPNVNFFGSIELDLFQNINNVKTNNVSLTSTYLSLRYKPIKKLSLTASYDNRRNVIYYESNRLYIDQLLSQETRQGMRLMANYNMTPGISINVSSFYRYQQNNPKPTKNYVANINFNNLPYIGTALNLNANTLETYYFNGVILGGRISKNVLKSKVYLELNYRNVNYDFLNSEQLLKQDIVGFATTMQLKKSTSLSISYEGTFEPIKHYHRYFITLMHRIKG
jgi:hypothetical protein